MNWIDRFLKSDTGYISCGGEGGNKSDQLLQVLRCSEKYRVQAKKEKQEEKKEARRKELAAWVPWVEEKKKEDPSADENDDTPLVIKGMKAVFTSFGGRTAVCLFLFLTGLAAGLFRPEEAALIRIWKILASCSSVLILLQLFYPVRENLYREVNLPYYMTMPFTSGEILMAEYRQLIGSAYKIMAILLLPLWLGFTLSKGWDSCLTEAVFLGLFLLPQFLLLLLFFFMILYYSYVRLFLPEKPLAGILVPAAAAGVLLLLSAAAELLTGGRVFPVLFKILWEFLFFNYPLGLVIGGMQVLPLLLLVLLNVLSWLLFRLAGRLLYRPSILQRWDMADPVPRGYDISGILKEHRPGTALFLREIRTMKGIRAYRIPNLLSSFLLPLVLLLLFMGMESLAIRIPGGGEEAGNQLLGVLIRYVVPLSVFPAWMNRPASTSFSRDAGTLDQLRIMGIDWESLLRTKILSSLFSCAKGSLPWIWILCAWLTEAGRIPFWGFLPVFLLNGILTAGTAEIRIMHDIRHPIRNWKNYKEMLKKGHSLPILPALVMLLFVTAGFLPGIAGAKTGVGLAWIFFFAAAFLGGVHLYLFIAGLRILEKLYPEKKEGMTASERIRRSGMGLRQRIRRGIRKVFRRNEEEYR